MQRSITTRLGELNEQVLVDALASERFAGGRPSFLAVGSPELEKQALGILGPEAGTLDELRAIVPNVGVDPGLPSDGWELR